MNNIIILPLGEKTTPQQALLSALEIDRERGLQSVVVIGYTADDDLVIRTSAMDRKDVLWISHELQRSALGDDE